MQITDIKPQKRKGRYSIFLDDRFGFGINEEILFLHRLKIGDNLDTSKIAKIKKSESTHNLFGKVLRFLSYRARSEKEITDYLSKKEAGPIEQQKIIRKLKKLNFLNDSEFARSWISNRVSVGGSGKRKIYLELCQKGVSKEIVEKTLNIISQNQEIESAEILIVKKTKNSSGSLGFKEKQKLKAFLFRRGFDYQTIKTAFQNKNIDK